jgi:hypothetical protein
MQAIRSAALAALLCALPCFADGVVSPDEVEASFDTARVADDLTGTLIDPAKEIRIRVYASAGSTVSATLTPDQASASPFVGPSMELCTDDGSPVDVTLFDKSPDDGSAVVWKKVKLAETGGHVFVVKGTAAGGWRLRLSGKLSPIKGSAVSSADLGVGAEAEVDVHGLRGGTLSFQLSPGTKASKFRGELVRVDRPDGSTIPGTLAVSKGKVLLDVDGVHKLVFRNAGTGIGPWALKTTTAPPPSYVRHGIVSATGTALTPIVLKVLPPSDFHGDDALSMTLVGRDFQSGADVRLVRKDFADILATDISVDSETQIRCELNLVTAPITGVDSIGKWRVGVWNAPVYGTADDRTTLVKDGSPNDQRKTFTSLAASAINLPEGVVAGTEVWQLEFNDDFQTDLNLMGFGSPDRATEKAARDMVERYVVCFLRVLMRQNETNGKLGSGVTGGISFVLGRIPSAAGKAGRDYNRIEIGGAWQTGDPRDVAEPLLWGFAPIDAGNTVREDLSVNVDDGLGGTTRAGLGVRTRVLDPLSGSANADWRNAMSPLNAQRLTAADQRYFLGGYAPTTVADATRYSVVVTQTTRAAREIAAIVAHHIGRAMGLLDEGSGPMANPADAGYFWPTTAGLAFTDPDLQTLRGNAVSHALPGKQKTLSIRFFPFISLQPYKMPDCTTAVAYSVPWNFVGGRPNAIPSDYTVKYGAGNPPSGMTLSFTGLAGTAPLWINQSQNNFNAGISYFRMDVRDTVRGGVAAFLHRLNILPNIPLLPAALQPSATNARNTILSTP